VIHRHKSNLIKLLTGQEGRIGEKAAGKGDKQACGSPQMQKARLCGLFHLYGLRWASRQTAP
jgi:hypothetical protein